LTGGFPQPGLLFSNTAPAESDSDSGKQGNVRAHSFSASNEIVSIFAILGCPKPLAGYSPVKPLSRLPTWTREILTMLTTLPK
jgi:hypothetical protein